MEQKLLLADNRELELQDLALEFSNTADWHASGQPVELLNSYADLIAWAQHNALLSESSAKRLTSRAERDPATAATVLERAISLREAIYGIFSATSAGHLPQQADLDALNLFLNEALAHIQIGQDQAGFHFHLVDTEDTFEQILWPVTYSAATLLTSDKLDRVKECEDDRGCGFLFYDTSKNRSRRWCSMRSCGNRAKVRRHRRQKGTDA